MVHVVFLLGVWSGNVCATWPALSAIPTATSMHSAQLSASASKLMAETQPTASGNSGCVSPRSWSTAPGGNTGFPRRL